ncbi:MAG: EamA family transporter, partial [Clostridia bacterium]|nr:EamA family transporter [Clostridia bacterium]
VALQIRQTTSAIVYGAVILPIMKGWGFTVSLFKDTGWLIPLIAIAALFATASYLFYYRAISRIGASKSMALNITYSAWAVVFSVVFLRDYGLLNPVTVICTAAVLIFGILAGADYKELIGKKN